MPRSSRAVRNPASVSGPTKQRKTTKHAQKQQQKHEADTTACGALLNATCGQTVIDRRANSILLGAAYARKGTEQHSLVGKRYLSYARKGTEHHSLVGKRYLSFARKGTEQYSLVGKRYLSFARKGNEQYSLAGKRYLLFLLLLLRKWEAHGDIPGKHTAYLQNSTGHY